MMRSIKFKSNKGTLIKTAAVLLGVILAASLIFLHLLGYKNYLTTASLWLGAEQKIPPFKSSFESEDVINDVFILNKIEPHSWKLDDNYSSDGQKCLAIKIKSGDKLAIKSGRAKGTERAEFQDPLLIPFNPLSDFWFRLDFMARSKASLPALDERLVFWQLKQFGGNNPLISMQYRKKRLGVKLRHADMQHNYYGPKLKRRKWHRVVVHARITKSRNGVVDIYLNDTQIVKYRGQTAYPDQPPLNFIKFGLYRDHYADPAKKLPPMTIYFDRYLRGASWEEVVPEGDPMPAHSKKALWRVKTKKLKSKKS
jgi:hypothetical protein